MLVARSKWRISALLFFSMACSSGIPASTDKPLQTPPEPEKLAAIPHEEYEVISSLIRQNLIRYKGIEIRTVLIGSKTLDWKTTPLNNEDKEITLPEARKELLAFRALRQETIDDYLAKNAQAYALKTELDLPVTYTLLDAEARMGKIKEDFINGEDGWGNLHKEFSGAYGINQFSRVGFDKPRKQALIYSEMSAGLDNGAGIFTVLVKTSDGWKIKKQFVKWIS